MENDYSKFFSTYNNVDPPPYTEIDNSIEEPTFISNDFITPIQNNISQKPKTFSYLNINETKEKNTYNPNKKVSGSIKSVMKNKGQIVTDVYNTLMNEGFTSAQACGILGNIMQESSFNVTNHTGDGGKSYGLFQFYKKGELPIYQTWKLKTNNNQPEHISQTLFVSDRLKHGNLKAVGIKTQTAYNYFNSDDPAKTAEGFNALFEKSADYKHPERLNKRKEYAEEFYNYFNNV